MAYQHIRDNGLLSEMRFRVFEEIVFAHEKGETLTSGEIDRILSRKKAAWTRAASPRLNELVKLGVIEEAGKRICSETGMLVLHYTPTGKLPDPKKLNTKVERRKPSRDVINAAVKEARSATAYWQDNGGGKLINLQKVIDWLQTEEN
jgi:hypothetical protein